MFAFPVTIAAPTAALISFRSASTALDGAGTTFTINKPAGTVEGDVMVYCHHSDSGVSISSAPSGWNQRDLFSSQLDMGTSRVYFYTKTAGASEPSSYDWTLSGGSASTMAAILTYQDATETIDGGKGLSRVSNPSDSHAIGSMTTSTANTMMICLWALDRGGNSNDPNITGTPSGMTNRVSLSGTPISETDRRIEVYEEARPSTGSTGSRTLTTSTSNDVYCIAGSLGIETG